jgi:hypothetical protein
MRRAERRKVTPRGRSASTRGDPDAPTSGRWAWQASRMPAAAFAPPGDVVEIDANDPRVFALASRLWREAPPFSSSIRLRVRVKGNWIPDALPERRLFWEHGETEFRCGIPGLFSARIDLAAAAIDATASPAFLERVPGLASRSLLEAPVAVLLARRGWRALHAGAVTSPKGAVVLRGGSGAGKSTLVAAARRAGLGVLGDESLLVSREDPDALASSVRELTLRPDGAALLGILPETEPAFSGGEEKRRVDLFTGALPEARSARRVTTLLLGPRSPGPARIVPLSADEFLEEFPKGEIPQEQVTDGSRDVAHAWANAGGGRLDGAQDLEGALGLLKRILQ